MLEPKLPVENKHEIVQAEINHILSSDPFIKTERDEELHRWLDKQRKFKVCGLVIEDKGSNLSKSCYDYFESLAVQRNNLFSIPLKVLYVRARPPGGAKNIHSDILNVLNRPLNTGNLRDLRKRVRGTLKSYQVQLLIIDDTHLLNRQAMVELIQIYEDLKIPVIMSGTQELEEILSKSKKHKHINNMFLRLHQYRTLTIDEVASVVAAWEEEVLTSWGEKEKPNLADNDTIIEELHKSSGGLVQHVYTFMQHIAINQLENTFNSSLEQDADIDEVLGLLRDTIVDF